MLTAKSIEQARNMMADTTLSCETDKGGKHYDLNDTANIMIKVIGSGIRDKFIRDVMTRRILSVVQTGKVRSHLSIALELGAREFEVIEAERVGVELCEELLRSLPEHIGKFNSDRIIAEEVKRMGNSIVSNP